MYVPSMDGTTPEVTRPRVRLIRATWDEQTSKRGLRTNAECAHVLGTSESTIHRIKAGDVEPSGKFIAAALWHLPGAKFEEMFEVVVSRVAS